jgi:hypothetical protein
MGNEKHIKKLEQEIIQKRDNMGNLDMQQMDRNIIDCSATGSETVN